MRNYKDEVIMFLEEEFLNCIELNAKLSESKIPPMDPTALIIKKLITIRTKQLDNELEVIIEEESAKKCPQCDDFKRILSEDYCLNCGKLLW